MTKTLFALVREKNSEHVVYRVAVNAQVQAQLDQLFETQEQDFLAHVDEEIEFDGMYKPDREEILYIEDAKLVSPLNATLEQNPTAYPLLDVGNLAFTKILLLFRESTTQNGRLLMQRFSRKQFLSNSGLSLILQGDTYRKLVEPGFSLDDKVSAYVLDNRVYFKSFFQLRTMLTVQEHFKVATETQVHEFANKSQLYVENEALFASNADQTSRRLIHGIDKSGVLETVGVETIAAHAMKVDIKLSVEDGKLVMPMEKKEMKLVLRFLEQSVYKGLLTEEVFVANSKRTVG
ncbi:MULTISPECIES: hypothetical protein [unclassified Roseovarius]|uniref:hypothetical protein n=1 Tax=unclassified Roseovarius TaxID=2614913 RepID=UPI00273FE713|nr:hypothetical protein [Roseovarius sp. MMSF_3350]